MNWKISFSRDADDFLRKNHALSEAVVIELIRRTIKMFAGERINVDVKKLKGEWLGFYRIRKGKARIIASFDFDNFYVFVEKIDWRGDVYK